MPVPIPSSVTEEHLKYLDALRKSGVTNMYGATPHLMEEFPVSKSEAREILAYGAEVDFDLSVGVVWTFAGDASCSDYIEIGGEWAHGIVNFGSQDSWIDREGYRPWCQRMADFLEKPFPYRKDYDDIDEDCMEPRQ